MDEPRASGRSLRAFSAPWRDVPPLLSTLRAALILGLREDLSPVSLAGGKTKVSRDAGSAGRPQQQESARRSSPASPAPSSLPQEEEAPSFLPGEFH